MPCVEQKVLSAQEWKANHPISNSTSHIALEYIDRTMHIIISVTENFEILYGCYMHHAMIFFKIMVKYISIIY